MAGSSSQKEIVFHIEVPSTSGLPGPERTFIRLSGLGVEEALDSEQQVEESIEPGGFLFQSPEALAEIARLKAEAEAAAATKKKGSTPEASRPESEIPPEPACRISRPCGTQEERQRLLDAVCSPLRVTLFRVGETPVPLAQASLDLSALIHDTASIELNEELRWSEELISELRTVFEADVAAAAEAAAAAKAEAEELAKANEGEGDGKPDEPAEGDGDGEAEEPPPTFVEPPPGRLVLRVSVAAPIGRVLCPEDLNDWAVLTVRLDGLYAPPQKLKEVGAPLPELPWTRGPVEGHPLRYALNLLGCEFSGGTLMLPEVELPPEEEEAGEAGADGAVAEGESAEPASPVAADPVPSFDIGSEEFVEGLMRAGFAAAKEDGPAVFEFLGRPRTGMGGRIGPQEFARLAELGMPAEPKKLVELHAFLIEKHEALETAFGVLDASADSCLSRETFAAGLEEMGYTATPEIIEEIFTALDSQRNSSVSREDFRMLATTKRMQDLDVANKAATWLLAAAGSLNALLQQADEANTGAITKENMLAAASRLGYPDANGVELVFSYLSLAEPEMVESISHKGFACISDLSQVSGVALALSRLEEMLLGGEGLGATGSLSGEGAGEAALKKLQEGAVSLSCTEFVAAIGDLASGEVLGINPQLLFFILDTTGTRAIGAPEFAGLPAFNAAARWRRLAAVRSFIEDGFGSVDQEAFKRFFEDRSQFFSEAEESMPFVKWEQHELHGYRGREWLQKLLNTLGDERGRNCVGEHDVSLGGAWLYLFPLLDGQDKPVDFKEITDAAQAGNARLARWHHGKGFLDLRRLAAPAEDGMGPEVEFRVFLTHADNQPSGTNDAGDMGRAPYGACQTYVRGSIRLDRPLLRLCPRDMQPPTLSSGEPFIPPPPEKPPPPTVNEELEKEASHVIGRLAFEFARMCQENGFEESQIVGPGGELGQHLLLGRKTVKRHMFVDWLEKELDGTALQTLGGDIRPAIVRLVRAENKDGPSCGLGGNENDARYTYLRDYILKHFFRALNRDVDDKRRLRDEKLWRSPLLMDPANAQDPDVTAVKGQEQDDNLKRLTFEYELRGDTNRARELYEQRLALLQNVENGDAWYGFARFLMRCGQHQLDAERVLRYVISLRPQGEGPGLSDVAFLACLLQNHALPSSLDAEGHRSARFDAAVALLEDYVDRHPTERLPLYFLFLVNALEAWGLQAEISAAGEAGQALPEETVIQISRLSAEAAKYLEMARASSDIFSGTLNTNGEFGCPSFPKLEALLRSEQINRGDATEVPAAKPDVPSSWQPPAKPAFPDAKAMQRLPEAEDAVALECIDLLLHFGLPDLARFLFYEAIPGYGFLSPVTAGSTQCKIQMIKAAMLARDWSQAETLVAELFSAKSADRAPDAHALLGEVRYQAACEAGANSEGFESALSTFETALSFLPLAEPSLEPLSARKPPKDDPVLHLRVASILHMRAEDLGFKDPAVADRAVYHYKRSLIAGPTAEAWKSVGVCAYRRAQLEASPSKRTRLLKDASRYLQEANVLDKERPQIIAWLAICAAELGQVQIAKQAVRQVLQFEERLDITTALELAGVLVRFSDEQKAAEWGGERGRLVQDGRYAQEAADVARLVISRSESGRARHFLACALALNGEHGAAAAQFSEALPLLAAEDPGALESAANMARQCADQMPGEPQLAALVEDAIQVALMEQQRSPGASDALPPIDETGVPPEADTTQMGGFNGPPES